MTAAQQPHPKTVGDPVPDVLHIWPEPFRGVFTDPTWRRVLVLVMGTLLAPFERWATSKWRRHKPITARARQGMLVIRRSFLKRVLIFVGDTSYGTHRPADTAIAVNATLISRLRLDASLYAAPEPRRPGQLDRNHAPACDAGKSRSPSRKQALIPALKPGTSGPQPPSTAPPGHASASTA